MFEPMRLFADWLTTEQEPVIPGCFLRARAIGLMPMIDQACSILQIFFIKILHTTLCWIDGVSVCATTRVRKMIR